jgi:hypothetical protein|nr:MAG TPA: hypothetical protein [Caudoviricetes sp.]
MYLKSDETGVTLSPLGYRSDRRQVKREYVIDIPDNLRLDGYTESPTLTRDGDEYLLENGILYGDSYLFTEEEAEKALKDLNVNWEIKKVR